MEELDESEQKMRVNRPFIACILCHISPQSPLFSAMNHYELDGFKYSSYFCPLIVKVNSL